MLVTDTLAEIMVRCHPGWCAPNANRRSRAPLDPVPVDVERLRYLLWNNHYEKACQALGRIVDWAEMTSLLNDLTEGAKIK